MRGQLWVMPDWAASLPVPALFKCRVKWLELCQHNALLYRLISGKRRPRFRLRYLFQRGYAHGSRSGRACREDRLAFPLQLLQGGKMGPGRGFVCIRPYGIHLVTWRHVQHDGLLPGGGRLDKCG